jgi:hypothetical protein
MTTLARSHDATHGVAAPRSASKRRSVRAVLLQALTPTGARVFDALADPRSGDYYATQRPPGWWYLG